MHPQLRHPDPLAQHADTHRGVSGGPWWTGYDPFSLSDMQLQSPSPGAAVLSDSVLDLYFARLHGKPYWILDEAAVRQGHRLGQLSGGLSLAVYALTIKFGLFPSFLLSFPC